MLSELAVLIAISVLTYTHKGGRLFCVSKTMSDSSCFVKSFYKVALKVTLGKTYWTQNSLNCSVWKELTRIEISLHSLGYRMLERGENVGNNILHVFLDSRIIQWATSYSLLYWKRCGGLSLVCGFFIFLVLLFEEQHLDLTVNKNNGNLQIDNWKCRLSCMY